MGCCARRIGWKAIGIASESSGVGEETNNFSFSPEITFSYRPKPNLEIFSSVYYSDQTIQIAEQGFYHEVPVGVDSTGNVIYERRLVN